MNKGILLENENPNYYFINKQLDIYSKYLDIFNNSVDRVELKKYVKNNNIKYIIIGYTSIFYINPLLDMGIPIIVNGGDPARRLYDDYFREYCNRNYMTDIITHSECTINSYSNYFNLDKEHIFLIDLGVDLEIIKDYKLQKINDVIHTGKFSNYQYRMDIHKILSNQNNIKYSRIRNINGVNPLNEYITYAKNMNSSWMSIGACTQEKNICYYKDKFISECSLKNFEIMGSNSCLLTTPFPDAYYLGLKDEYNCVLFNNVREAYRKIVYYLEDKELLRKIIERGYDLTREKHNITKTVPNLINQIEKKYAN